MKPKPDKLTRATRSYKRWIKNANAEYARMGWQVPVGSGPAYINGWFYGYEKGRAAAKIAGRPAASSPRE